MVKPGKFISMYLQSCIYLLIFFPYSLNFFFPLESKSVGKEHCWAWVWEVKQTTRLKNLRSMQRSRSWKSESVASSQKYVVRYFLTVSAFPICILEARLRTISSTISRIQSEETVYITVNSFDFWISDRWSVVETITRKLLLLLLSHISHVRLCATP